MYFAIINKILKNSLLKNGALFAFFSFLNSGINFLLLLVLANFIYPSEYGELNLFNTFVTLLAIFVSLNATGIIAVDFFSTDKKHLCRMLNTVLCLSSVSFCFFSILLLLFSSFFESAIGLSIEYQWLGLLVCYTQVFSVINLDIWRLEEKPISYGLYSVATIVANFALTLVLVICFKQGWLGRLYAQVSVSTLFFFISICFLRYRGYLIKICPTKQSIKAALGFGVPLIPHNASIWVRQGLDRYIINYFYLATQVGLYSFAYNFANIIQIIGLAFNATNSVYIYKNLAKKDEGVRTVLRHQTKMMIIFFTVITFLVCIGTVVFIPIWVPEYAGAIPYLIPLCISALFQCIYYLFVNYIFYFKKTKELMYITFSLSLLHLILSIILTRYSVMYTAYVTMFINFVILLSVFLYSRRIYKLI